MDSKTKEERLKKIEEREKVLEKITAAEKTIHTSYSDIVFASRPRLGRLIDVSVYRALRFVIFREMFGSAFDEILHHVGSRLAREWAPNNRESLQNKFKESGLGILETLHFMRERCVFRVYESMSAAGIPRLSDSVCVFEGGILSGAANYLLGVHFVSKETACLAKGDNFCEHELTPAKEDNLMTPESKFMKFLSDEHLWKENSDMMTALAAQFITYKHNEEMAIRDGLTGLFNHRYFQEKLREEMKRSKRTRKPLTVIMIDIDKFKGLNDAYGHQQGDIVLKNVSRIISSQIRSTDFVGRYGGEEFVIILPETDAEPACEAAEKIRVAVCAEPFKLNNDNRIVSISLGVATYPRHAHENALLIEKADDALYHSKRTGRNKVTLFSEDIQSKTPVSI